MFIYLFILIVIIISFIDSAQTHNALGFFIAVRLLVGATKNVGAESFFVSLFLFFFFFLSHASPGEPSTHKTGAFVLVSVLSSLQERGKEEKSEGRATGAAAVRLFHIFSRFIF